MTGLEKVCRALAYAHFVRHFHEELAIEETRTKQAVEKAWPEFRTDAVELLRGLKGQPPHIADAGTAKFADESFDQMIEAIVRAGA